MTLAISLPEDYHLLVKTGQTVDFDTPFAEKKTVSEIHISVSTKLDIPPVKIFNYLKKFVGDDVKKNEILAVKKSFFSTKKVISDNQGKIKEVDHNTGEIVITTAGNKKNIILSWIKGEITDIKKNRVSIKVKESREFPLRKTTGDFGQEVFYLKNKDFQPSFTQELSGKILFGESLTSYLQSKTEALGINGYVTLATLPEESELPYAYLKSTDDVNQIFSLNFPYCLVDSKSSKITFYR